MEENPKVTLDTSALRELWDGRTQAIQLLQLVELAKEGKVDLAVTARVHEDIPNQPLASRLETLGNLHITEIASVVRMDISVLGRDVLGLEGFEERLAEAQELADQRIGARRRAKPPDWKDWDHLHAHMLQERDYFVTLDYGILCLADELYSWFGIVVLAPQHMIQKVKSA